jgi:hypothetical protein
LEELLDKIFKKYDIINVNNIYSNAFIAALLTDIYLVYCKFDFVYSDDSGDFPLEFDP